MSGHKLSQIDTCYPTLPHGNYCRMGSKKGVLVAKQRSSWGEVEQLPSKKYRARYAGPDSRRYNSPVTFDTKTDAHAWLSLQRASIIEGTWTPNSYQKLASGSLTETGPTVGELLDAWVERGLNARTMKPWSPSYTSSVKKAVAAGLSGLRAKPAATLNASTIRKWHADRVKSSGASSAGREARILRSCLNQAVADEILANNPVPKLLGNSKTGIKHRPPTTEELVALIAAMPPRLRLAVQIAAFGGLRLSEWRGLRRCNITKVGKNYVIDVAQQAQYVDGEWLVRETKSEAGIAPVTLPEWLSKDVKHHLKQFVEPGPEALLCPSGGSGEFIDTAWRKAWDRARKTVGVKDVVREHDLRHYYGTALSDSGAGVREIQGALRQSTPQAALIYMQKRYGASAQTAARIKKPKA